MKCLVFEPLLVGSIISADVGVRKPDAGIYRILQQHKADSSSGKQRLNAGVGISEEEASGIAQPLFADVCAKGRSQHRLVSKVLDQMPKIPLRQHGFAT